MDFSAIVNSISTDDIINAGKNPDAITPDQLEDNFYKGNPIKPISAQLSIEFAKKNIAAYARLITEHVGYDSFDQENKNTFQKAIEDFYNNPSESESIAEKKFAERLSTIHKTISTNLDRHCMLVRPTYDNTNPSSQQNNNKNIPASSEKNPFQGLDNLEHTLIAKDEKSEKKLWEIHDLTQHDGEKIRKKILYIQISSCGRKDGEYDTWSDIIKCFDEAYGDTGENWNKIILDVRGNGGGEDKAISHIAQRTYGNRVNSYKRCVIRDSQLSDYMYKKGHGIFTKFLPKTVEVLPRNNFSNEIKSIFDETLNYYTFNEEQGYKGDIDVLIDRGVGSAAESAYTLFYHHPKIRYIGENTYGMQQFQQGWANLPCGFGMRIGVTKLTYWDCDNENIECENIECKGHKPDIECPSEDALKEALTNTLEAFQHQLNETVPAEHKTPAPNGENPYNMMEPELRKSYSAIYVEPALERVEFENIINSLSKEDLIAPEKQKKDGEMLTVEERKKMLAYMGRFIYNAHGGFADGNPDIVFPEAVRQNFITSFLKLYKSEEEKNIQENLGDVFKLLMTTIPDNHANLFNADGSFFNLPPNQQEAFKSELRIMLKNPELELDPCQRGKIERYLSEPNQNDKNITFDNRFHLSPKTTGIQWKTGTVSQPNGKKVYVIGISSFAPFNEQGQFSPELIKDFTNLAKQLSKMEYKNKDGLIIDLRGNRGGWPYIGDYLARCLYGNTVTSSGSTLQRDTLERALVESHMQQTFEQDKQKLIQESFSGKTTEETSDNWMEKYPFAPTNGISMPIIILTNRDTGSNAEATCEKLSAHPYVRFVGDNTKGCLQFGHAPTGNTALPLPYGGKLGISLGASSSSTIPGRYEGIGITPDYPLKGNNAMAYALNNFDKIAADINTQTQGLQNTTSHTASDCTREAYIENLTEKNVQLMENSGNVEAAKAVKELSDITKEIPSEKDGSSQEKKTPGKPPKATLDIRKTLQHLKNTR